MAADAAKSPVSFRLQVNRLPPKGATVTVEADDEQRAALAHAHGLLLVERFSADLVARPWKGDGVQVTGRVEADVTQACVVTLEPIAARIDEKLLAVFVPEGSRLARADQESGEIIVEADGEDLPESFAGDSVDLGALAEEFFALGIDPYPRKKAAALDLPATEEAGETGAGPLYEGLKKLREKG